MSDFQFSLEEADDEFEFSESGVQWTGRDATIFLIDASPQMFERPSNDESDESPFIKSLRCAHSTVARKIIGNDQDLYGIVLFNTKQSKNALDFANIYVLQEVDRPGAERMLQLEGLLEDETGNAAKDKYGSSKEANIHEVLWVCRNIFIGSKKNLLTKNVLMFTCEDDPHSANEHKQRQAIKGAKDLKEGGIDIEILPFGDSFNPRKFYKELLTQGEGDEDDSESLSILANPAARFEELLERVRRLEHKQRSTGRVSFSIAPGVEMGVKVFTTIRKITKSKVKLYKRTNEEILSQRREYLESGELLMPSDFVKYREFGKKKIKFTLDEIKSLSRVYEPGIELLGFKPMSSFKPYFYIKSANFIYPDESSVKGSCKLFACLLERCLSRRVCPVVRVVAREGGSVTWAFLLPQEEVKDDGGCQEKPPGFYICYLPFADDFRSVELANRTRAQPDQVDAAKDFIKKLHFKYHPDCFENPDIQTHWRNIEALALNRAYLAPVTDYTVPDHKGIEKKAGRLIDQFKSLVLPPSYDPEAILAKKRPSAPSSSKPAPKKSKPDSASVSVEEMARRHTVDKLTVDVLKHWLQERGVRVTGKRKPQLVQDVYDEL